MATTAGVAIRATIGIRPQAKAVVIRVVVVIRVITIAIWTLLLLRHSSTAAVAVATRVVTIARMGAVGVAAVVDPTMIGDSPLQPVRYRVSLCVAGPQNAVIQDGVTSGEAATAEMNGETVAEIGMSPETAETTSEVTATVVEIVMTAIVVGIVNEATGRTTEGIGRRRRHLEEKRRRREVTGDELLGIV